jgi:hypothetical protein
MASGRERRAAAQPSQFGCQKLWSPQGHRIGALFAALRESASGHEREVLTRPPKSDDRDKADLESVTEHRWYRPFAPEASCSHTNRSVPA